MKPYNLIIFIFLSVFSVTCIGQTKTDILFSAIQTGKIENLTSFKRLTKYEIRIDSLMEKHNKRSLKMMLDGKAFIKGTSRDLIDSAIQEEKVLSTIRYRENRSRYQFYQYKNGQLLDNTQNESDLDSVGTECSCILDGDTLRVNMGIWVFGGFAFPIKLVGQKFKSNYWIDEHKRKIFKLNENDSLTDNIFIPIVEQKLILDSFPTYRLGQQLTGHYTFKSTNYFRAADFENWSAKDEYSDKSMDTMQTKGIIIFTCKVRQKLQRDQ